MKKFVAVLLSAAMVAGLTACGSGSKDKTDSEGTAAAASAEAKQYVYQYADIQTEEIPAEATVRSVSYQKDKIYALYDWWGEQEYLAVLSANADGTECKVSTIAMPESTEKENAYLSTAAISGDGRIYLVMGVSTLTDAANDTYASKLVLQCWSLEGEKLWEQEVSADTNTEYQSVMAMNTTDSGVQLLCSDDSSYWLTELDADGNQTDKQTLEESKLQNVYSAVPQKAGTWFFLSYNNDYTTLKGITYNPEEKTFGEPVQLPANIQNYQLTYGEDGSFLITNQYGVSVWKEGDTQVTQLMNLVDSDLAAYNISYPVRLNDEQFAAVYDKIDGSGSQLAVFTKVKPEDVPDKETLVLGGNYIGSDVRARVIAFNKENAKYKILIKDYSDYATTEDYNAGTTQLNTDILAGKMPDILLVSSDMPVSNLVKKGLLADIDELIAQDTELSGTEFLENVFDAYRIDGKLYQVISAFTVNTFVGKKSVLGDISGWNMEEFRKYADNLPEGAAAFGETTRDGFMQYAMQYCGNDYIDSTTGKSHFDSEEFVNLIKYAATLPETIAYDEDYDWTVYANQYRTGQTLLMPLNLYDFRSLSTYINGSFGEEIVYVGFPTAGKDGSAIEATGNSYAIAAKSAHKDVAWEFVRQELTKECQTRDSFSGMPVNKEAFLEMAQRALEKPYYIDENGQKVEYDDIYYLNDEEIILPQLTQEQVNQAVAFVEGLQRKMYQNTSVEQIMNEELPAFWEGQKSAEDVAAIIQNRVQLYLDENGEN